jgi:hypothetical protein
VSFPNASQTYYPPISFSYPPTNPLFFITLSFNVNFSIPTVDIHPASMPWSATLPPNPGEFTVRTRLIVSAKVLSFPPLTNPNPLPLGFVADVLGRCEPVVSNSSGTGTIGINVKDVHVVPLTPTGLSPSPILDAILLTILQAILANVSIPFNTFTAGAFGLSLQVGPLSRNHQFELRGQAL